MNKTPEADVVAIHDDDYEWSGWEHDLLSPADQARLAQDYRSSNDVCISSDGTCMIK